MKAVRHAGIKMHLQLTVAEGRMQLHRDTHHWHPEIHPPSCLIYSELLNRCLFGINALEIKLRNNEMAARCLLIHTGDYRIHFDPFPNQYELLQCERVGPV